MEQDTRASIERFAAKETDSSKEQAAEASEQAKDGGSVEECWVQNKCLPAVTQQAGIYHNFTTILKRSRIMKFQISTSTAVKNSASK